MGLLFLSPLVGAVVGAAGGALSGALIDIGVNDDTVKEIGETLQPGTSALFLLVRHATYDRVVDALRPYRPKIIRSSLSYDTEEQLAQALAKRVQNVQTFTSPPAATTDTTSGRESLR